MKSEFDQADGLRKTKTAIAHGRPWRIIQHEPIFRGDIGLTDEASDSGDVSKVIAAQRGFNVAPSNPASTSPTRWLEQAPRRIGSGVASARKPPTIEVDGQQRPTTNSNGQPFILRRKGYGTSGSGSRITAWLTAGQAVGCVSRLFIQVQCISTSAGLTAAMREPGFYFTTSEDVASGYVNRQTHVRAKSRANENLSLQSQCSMTQNH